MIQRIQDIERRLEALEGERRELVSELSRLRSQSIPVAELPLIMGSEEYEKLALAS